MNVLAMRFSTTVVGIILTLVMAVAEETPRPVPKFELRNVDGKLVKSKTFAARTLLFAFIATWDKNSQQQLGPLKSLQTQFATDEFSVVGIVLDTQNVDGVRKFVVTNSLQFAVLLADYDLIRDFGGLDSIPTLFLADKNGMLVRKYVGVTDEKVLATDLKTALGKGNAP